MAKISVSIPDELKDQLDRYAEDNDLTRSDVVGQALEAFFQGGPPPDDGEQVKDYVARLAVHQERMRQSLIQIGTYVPIPPEIPGPMPRPPW